MAAGGTIVLALASGCQPEDERAVALPVSPPRFEPTRDDWAAFRKRHPGLPEPNYLPFLLHRVRSSDPRGDALVFCRWDEAQMPIVVAIDPPTIEADDRRAVAATEPAEYVAAVEHALGRFEHALAGAVRFDRDDGADAMLRVRMLGERAPVPEPNLQVLGTTALGGACQIDAETTRDVGRDDALAVRYAAREIRLYVTDEHGLLTTDQVERIALHELGHAMGMRGHSPVPADLMFEAANDHEPKLSFSAADIHSFRGLYALPNGTVYAWLAPDATRLPAVQRPTSLAVGLAAEEQRDARSGLVVRAPRGWLVADGPHGLVAVDGTMWDYAASLQLIVRDDETPETYLEHHRAAHVGDGFLRRQARLVIGARPARRLEIEARDGDRIEQITLMALPGERLLVAIADAAFARFEATAALFDAVLGTVRMDPEPLTVPRRIHPRP